MINAVIEGGGELVSVYAKEPELITAFSKRYPQAKRANSSKEILEDSSIQLVLSSAIPVERAPLGIEVMQHGKDFLVDKPGITTLEQLAEVRRVQKETHRSYTIYIERLESRIIPKAEALIKAGAIGKVIQTIGLGPHRMNPQSRPEWFFDKKYFGGVITDLASHQFDQFIYFTGSTQADIVSARVGNLNHPQYPNFEDFGDAMLTGDKGTGYLRVDWFSPDGLKTFGDGRQTILGTDGYIELRKTVDLSGKEGGDHLFLVNQKDNIYVNCSKEPLLFSDRFINDILNRTETAIRQEEVFLAAELGLKAQAKATELKLNG
jgi:predicted dehydrogenase